MRECCQQRRLCYSNMLKKYTVDCSAPYTQLTLTITSNIEHGEIATQDGQGAIDEGFVGVSVRLRNLDLL